MRELKGFCEGYCCNGPCYLKTNIEKIAIDNSMEFSMLSEEEASATGTTKSPTTLVMKNSRVVKKIEGKLIDTKLNSLLESLGWT
tara:strand:+ start:962 stop:1216 length:255 start_codon:yes stop_codon:yes gene_type:complete